MIYSYFSPFITALLSYSLVLSTFLSWAQSSASEPIGWIGCNDRLTNRERRNTKGSVSLHQPCMTSSLSRRVNSRHGDDNRQIRLFLSFTASPYSHTSSPIYYTKKREERKFFLTSVSWQLVGYQDIPRFRKERVSEKGGVEKHNQTVVLYIMTPGCSWIIAWLWPVMGSLEIYNFAKFFVFKPSLSSSTHRMLLHHTHTLSHTRAHHNKGIKS